MLLRQNAGVPRHYGANTPVPVSAIGPLTSPRPRHRACLRSDRPRDQPRRRYSFSPTSKPYRCKLLCSAHYGIANPVLPAPSPQTLPIFAGTAPGTPWKLNHVPTRGPFVKAHVRVICANGCPSCGIATPLLPAPSVQGEPTGAGTTLGVPVKSNQPPARGPVRNLQVKDSCCACAVWADRAKAAMMQQLKTEVLIISDVPQRSYFSIT